MKRATNLLPIVLIMALTFSVAFVPRLWEAGEPRDLKARDPKAVFALSGVGNVYDEVAPLLEGGAAVPCTAGVAGSYPCENVDLLGIVPLAELGGVAGNDSWGWTDPETKKEYAIMGTGRSTAFVDVTDPTNPLVMGTVGQANGELQGATGILWRDIKVNDDHAYIVTERGAGMQVVDLTQLRDITVPGPQNQLEVKAVFTGQGFSSAHNLGINEETDRAYLVGGVRGGVPLIVDISDPENPTYLGEFRDPKNSYTHDIQCVVYRGPDDDYNGTQEDDPEPHELCFASQEDFVLIFDATDPTQPQLINRVPYDSASYTHQGWLTPDQRFFVFNDEGDESGNQVPNTTTYIVELEDLDAEYTDEDVVRYEHSTLSVDHNLYIVGDLIFEANYNAGLRVLRYTPETLRSGELEEVGYFDVDPALDINQYGGAWNVYPFFESGTIIVSTLDEGLFVLRFNDPASD